MIQIPIFGVHLSFSDFLAKSLKLKKTGKKDHSFYNTCNTVSLIKPHLFYEIQLFDILKNILLHHSKKPIHFTNFPANKCLAGVRKTFALHHLQTPNNCILEALGKQMSVYSCISL